MTSKCGKGKKSGIRVVKRICHWSSHRILTQSGEKSFASDYSTFSVSVRGMLGIYSTCNWLRRRLDKTKKNITGSDLFLFFSEPKSNKYTRSNLKLYFCTLRICSFSRLVVCDLMGRVISPAPFSSIVSVYSQLAWYPLLAKQADYSYIQGFSLSVPITSIREVRVGSTTDAFTQCPEVYADDRCFSIIHGDEFSTLDLVFPTQEESIHWTVGLRYLLAKNSGIKMIDLCHED